MNNDMVGKKGPTPFVSVICPVRNAAATLPGLVDALLDQTYPVDAFELIFVDNGSTDGSVQYLETRGVHVAVRDEVQSSYHARNHGVRLARGDVYAFIDSDCIPQSQWLERGINSLRQRNLDLAAGQVQFFSRGSMTSWNLFDSLVYMDNERCVLMGHAKTANVFSRASVFKAMGEFSGHVTSGGDVEWTSRAVKSGFRLGFEPTAVVYHPARNTADSLRKAIRVGQGKRVVLANRRHGWAKLLVRVATCVVPVEIPMLHNRLRSLGYPWRIGIEVYIVALIVRLTGTIGILSSIGWKFGTRSKS